jgi:son of sevenless-like protein
MSKIVSELQRFQVPYNLLEVPELQSYLRSSLDGLEHGADVGSLYRQSLVVEPRSTFEVTPANSFRGAFADPFNWKS